MIHYGGLRRHCGKECLLNAQESRIPRRSAPGGEIDALAFSEEQGRFA
jgi:hypothetical protein